MLHCILSSGNQPFHTRLLTKNGQYIVWDPWLHAANWDEKTNSRLIHHKLTSSHLRPDSSEKMRNHLAEDVLDENMLNLMKQYQMSLINGTELDSTIEFLENASKMVKFFRDARPVVSMSDVRVNEIKSVLHWFQGWMAEIPVSNVSTKQRGKMLPSQKCLDDVESCILVFLHVCSIQTTRFKGKGIAPSRFNSDLAENIFCQQRGLYNGNSTNPNYYSYRNTMNNIILGQSSKSSARKSNAGILRAKPFPVDIHAPPKKKGKKT